jgi:hypothetical protein
MLDIPRCHSQDHELMSSTVSTISPLSPRRAIRTLLLVALILGGLVGYAVCRWRVPYKAAVRPLAMTGAWMRPPGLPGYAGYFRHRVILPGPIKHAWIAVAARQAFEVTVNGNMAGRLFLWKTTFPFQYGLSESGQVYNKLLPSFPFFYNRDCQWSYHRNDWLPVFLDLTPRLHPGTNVIGIEIESCRAPALVRVDGEIELWSGQRIRIDSGPSWHAEPTPPARPPLDWTETNYPDLDWHHAITVADAELADAAIHYQTFNPRLLTTAFGGEWLRHPEANADDAAWFETTWLLGQQPADAWVRVAVNRPYDLFINDHRVSVPVPAPPNLDAGDWLSGTQQAIDQSADPEQLDPDEVGSIYAGSRKRLDPDEVISSYPGSRFESPLHGDPASFDFRRYKNLVNRNRSKQAPAKSREATRNDLSATDSPRRAPKQVVGPEEGDGDPLQEHSQPLPTIGPMEPQSEGADDAPLQSILPPYPEDSTPKALVRDRGVGTVDAYSIRWMLRPGRNTISVRLVPPLSVGAYNWPAQVAVDAEAVTPTGARSVLVSGPGWSCLRQDRRGWLSAPANAVAVGPALTAGPARAVTATPPGTDFRGRALPPDEAFGVWGTLPKTNYRGEAYHPTDKLIDWASWGGLMAAAVVLTVVLVLAAQWAVSRSVVVRADTARDRSTALGTAVQTLTGVLLVPAVVLATAVLVECSWMERHESLLFQLPTTWPLILGIAAALALAAGQRRRPGRENVSRAHRATTVLGRLPETRGWWSLIGGLLVACAVLRIHNVGFQSLHDDEYASVQAILEIARTGLPRFVPEGFGYSRSPLYHYLVGAVVAVCGENLWSLRLPTVFFSVASALLLYLCGSRLLNRPWVGLGALTLFTIHPISIFSGHSIRFYQQQQFFGLLAVYWFCEGFVRGSSQRYRYLTLAAFLAAVLSQELTAVMGLEIALGILLFARDNGRSANFKLLIVGCCIVTVIALDYLVFKTRCLTRLEGVSPRMEPAIKPHFWCPFNFASLFLCSSRLHIVPSVLLLLAMPSLVRGRDRVVWALLWFMLSGVVLTNLFVTTPGIRFIYRITPLWMLLVVRGIDVLASGLDRLARGSDSTATGHPWLRPVSAAVLFSGVILSWSPWRVVSSYETKLLIDTAGAFRYVRSQLREGDLVVAHEPLAVASLYEVGRVDYALSVPVFHDFFMLKHGRLIDRNSGVEVLGSLRQLLDVCKRHPRVWVVVNRELFKFKGEDIDWTLPGARVELFLRKNLEIKYRSFQWTVFLWDASKGSFAGFRGEEP